MQLNVKMFWGEAYCVLFEILGNSQSQMTILFIERIAISFIA